MGVSKLLSFCSLLRVSVRQHTAYPSSFQVFLQNLPVVETCTLANGLVVATEARGTYGACVGLFVDAGSRYESQYNNGIAHFFEHIAYTGTCCRTKQLLQSQMGETGARFKSFTTREMVGYYAECLCEDVPLITNLLSDAVFNNSLTPEEIESKKKVVYEEMIERDTDLDVQLYDYLIGTAYQGTPLAQTVVGPSNNLPNFCNSTIKRYLEKYFYPSRTVLVAVGGVTHAQMVCLAEQYLGALQPSKCVDIDTYRYTGSEVRFRDDSMPMANVAMAMEGPSLCDDDNYALAVAATIVGGWDRTQYGGLDHASELARGGPLSHQCVAYKSFNINFKDGGLWGIQFMVPSVELADMVTQIQDVWLKICVCASYGEVEQAKRQLKTKLLAKTVGAADASRDIARWVLYHGHRPGLCERLHAIDRVSVDAVIDTCTKYIYDKCPVVAAVGPTEGLTEYTRLRSGFYWLRW